MLVSEVITDKKLKEKIEYIFDSFKKAFPLVRFDEREDIIGIGEEGKWLLCYFLYGSDGELLVRFRCDPRSFYLRLNETDISLVDDKIAKTVKAFKENDFSLKRAFKKDISSVTESTVPQKTEKRYKKKERTIFDKVRYREIIDGVDHYYDEFEIIPFCSVRLINCFAEANVKTFGDLRKWDIDDLEKLKNFRQSCYSRLFRIATKFYYKAVFKDKQEQIALKRLDNKATRRSIRKWGSNKYITERLESIGYDEKSFGPNTIGRCLCLRKKLPDFKEIKVTIDENELINALAGCNDAFDDIYRKVETKLAIVFKSVIENERDLQMVVSYLGLCVSPKTIRQVAESYGVQTRVVTRVFNKALKKTDNAFSVYSEDGLKLCREVFDVMKETESIGIGSFFVYLIIEYRKNIVKAFKRVFLKRLVLPDGFYDNVKTVFDYVTNNRKRKSKKMESIGSNVVTYCGFDLVADEQGEIVTDIDLLNKMRAKRSEISKEFKTPAFAVFTNKQLVALATMKPLSKNEYVLLSGFTERNWETYGKIMTEIIVEHEKSEK